MAVKVVLADEERYATFRELQLAEKEARGWILVKVRGTLRPQYIAPFGDLPPGTKGQVLTYSIRTQAGNLWRLAKVHQYVLPDGTIRGGPDPVYITLHDVVLTRFQDRPTS